MITEVELSPPEVEGQRTLWVEIHNPTNEAFNADLVIRPLGEEYPEYAASSVRFNPGEYAVLEIWDSSIPATFPNENVVLVLYAAGEEVDRTPALTDASADSMTWQLDGSEWVFAEATPTRVIPEFGPVAAIVVAAGIAGVVLATRRFSGLFMK
jgi:hypothetical protein